MPSPPTEVQTDVFEIPNLEMYPSLDSARFDSVLTRVFKEKAQLGSARSLSLKTRSMEKAQNESF